VLYIYATREYDRFAPELGFMDIDALHELQKLAVQTALQSGRIEDLEKAANITKQVADVNKASSDTVNQPKLLRYEEFKAWATLIVPFLSIATLAVTIFIQSAQLNATREANEDTQWRETVKNVLSQLNKPSSVVADPALAMSLLEPYAANNRYQKDAIFLSVELLSRVPSSDRFVDYFQSHQLGEKQSDIPFLTMLGRELYSNLAEVNYRLQQPAAPQILKPASNALFDDIEFLSGKLCGLYHSPGTTTPPADLRDLFLVKCDLSGVNLTGVDLTGAKLQSVNLKDAILGGNVKFSEEKTFFVDTHWWDAREISRPLLKFLIDKQYPYFDNEGVQYNVPPPEKRIYIDLVRQLCGKVNLHCDPSTLQYGEPPAAKSVKR
jgi:hypothetical protein